MNITTKELSIKGVPVKIHAIPTGSLAIKKAAMNTKNPGMLKTLLTSFNREFTEWLPVWCWVIEHPEGIFLIDTGEISEVNNPDHFKPLGALMNFYFRKQMKFNIKRNDEIDQQLQQIGLTTTAIDKVVLTHLHIDHADGLKHFPDTPIVVSQLEWDTKHGVFPQLLPSWFAPEKVELNHRFDLFDKAHYITEAKDLVMVHTPGHTHGHCSVVLQTDQGIILFAGDVVYYEQQFFDLIFSATIASYKDSVKTCQKIKQFATNNAVVFLSSHEQTPGEKLKQMRTLEVKG